MKRKLIHFPFLALFLISGIVRGQNIFLKGKYVEIGVHPAGSFGSSKAAPTGYHGNAAGGLLGFICDVNKDGWNTGTPNLMGDYFVPGSPEEGWGIEWSNSRSGTSKSDFFNFGLMGEQEVSMISHQKVKTTGREQSQWIGSASNAGRSALIYQTVSLDSLAQYFTINVLIKNTGTDTLFNVGYFRNVDPDNEQRLNGNYITHNYIQHQPGWWGNVDKASVVAYGNQYKSPCILGAIDSRAHVSIGGFSVRDINDIFDFSDSTLVKSNPNYRDEAISIAFDLQHIAPGKCVTLAYYYALQNINPEDIAFPVSMQFDISDDGFTTSQSFVGGNLCVRDTILDFAVKTNGTGASFIDKVFWDADMDGIYELQGDTVEIVFKGWKKHKFSQRIVFCDGTQSDSTYEIFIEPKPVIELKATTQNPCFNEHEFTFENNSYWIKDSIQTFTWKFEGGDEHVGSKPEAYHFDSFSNNKWIRLVAETTIGCIDSNQISIDLSPSPKIVFQIPDSAQCLRNNEFNGIINASIDLGDISPQIAWQTDRFDTLWNSKYTYDSSGVFAVMAKVVSDKGCFVLDSQFVTVYAQPTANFSVDDSAQCFNTHEFNFLNSSKIDSGVLVSSWTSANGLTETEHYSAKFQRAGSETIQLKVVSEFGCTDSIEKRIYIHPDPIADFESITEGQCLKGNKFIWNNKSIMNGNGSAILRIIGSGFSDTLLGEPWEYTFNSEGDFQTRLLVENEYGCIDSARTEVTVFSQAELNINSNSMAQCISGNNFTLSSGVKIVSGRVDLHWEVSDGQNATGASFENIRFSVPGEKQVWLISESNHGCKDSVRVVLRVWEKPELNFNLQFRDSCVNTQDYKIDLSANNVSKSKWYSNNTFLGISEPENNKFQNGDRIKWIGESENGCFDSSEVIVRVYEHPVAAFVAQSQVCSGSEFSVKNISQSFGIKTDFTWFINDNQSEGLDVNPIVFTDVETLDIRLLARNIYGCMHDTSWNVDVIPKSFAEMAVLKEKACAKGNKFSIKAQSKNAGVDIVKNVWKWNDGTIQLGEVTQRAGLPSGTHKVTLETQNSLGCLDTLETEVAVLDPIQLSANSNSVCVPQMNTFISNSSVSNDVIKREIWQVAGQEFYGRNTRFNLRLPGTYDVRYMLETEKGCKDTLFLEKAAILRPKPKAAFKLDSFYSEGMGMSLVLKDKSSSDVDQWGWSFNDWEYSADQNPMFLFTDTGIINMTLIVGNAALCYDTVTREMGPYFPMFYLHVPNAFTPDGDDVNQNFKPVITSYLMKYKLEVYNHWGELLFNTNDPNESWDGTFNDQPVQEGVYVYIIYATDLMGDFYNDKGVVTLLRK